MSSHKCHGFRKLVKHIQSKGTDRQRLLLLLLCKGRKTKQGSVGSVIYRERAFALQVSSLKATRSTLGQVVGGARGTEGVSCHPETLWVNSTHFLSAAAKDCMFPSEKDSCGILCLSSGERLSWVVSAKGRPKFSNWFSPYAHRCVRC